MTVQLDWKAWNAKRKSMGGRFKKNATASIKSPFTAAKAYAKGVGKARKAVFGTSSAKALGKKFISNAGAPGRAYVGGIKRARKAVFGTSSAKGIAKRYASNAGAPIRAYVGGVKKVRGAVKSAAKRAWGKVKRFEGVEPTIMLQEAPEELYNTLVDFITEAEDGEKAFFDKTEFDLEGVGLPETEDGYYEIDHDTAAKVLDALDEILVDEEDDEEFEEDEIPGEEEDPDEEELDEYEEAQLELQNRVIALEQQLAVKEVDAAIAQARAYRDERGFGHAAITLEIFEALMKGEPLSDTIALEDASDPASVGNYMREGLLFALSTMPGQMPMEGKTVGGEVKKLEAATDSSKFEAGKRDAKTFWSKL